MHAVFPFVLFGSIGLFVLLGVISMLTRRNLHDQIGQSGLYTGDDLFGGGSSGYGEMGGSEMSGAGMGGPGLGGPGSGGSGFGGSGFGGSDPMREIEIRQMLNARSERLVRQGHPPLDIDAELARLQLPDAGAAGGSHDSALAAEVRGLVHARNERRERRGLEALDVEVEVQRTLAELDP
jgi:hypothetical protein